GAQDLLSFIRNAQYTLHVDAEISGLKRIVGSFTEASVFARSTLGALAFTGTLWLCSHRPLLTGSIALASIVLAVLSPSSPGLAGLPVVLIILYAPALARCGRSSSARYSAAAVLCGPPIILAVLLVLLLNDGAWTIVRDYVGVVVLEKSTSDSGIE